MSAPTWTFIIAVLNSVGANVTITSAFPLAGTTPRVQNQLNQECMIERRAASLVMQYVHTSPNLKHINGGDVTSHGGDDKGRMVLNDGELKLKVYRDRYTPERGSCCVCDQLGWQGTEHGWETWLCSSLGRHEWEPAGFDHPVEIEARNEWVK